MAFFLELVREAELALRVVCMRDRLVGAADLQVFVSVQLDVAPHSLLEALDCQVAPASVLIHEAHVLEH